MKRTTHDAYAGAPSDSAGAELPEEPRPYIAPLPGLFVTALLSALAGGLGWGIRGQYGHETGAMVPGVLVAFVLVFLACPYASSLRAARAVALTALAFGIGGSMTYGQTVGLTHDYELHGNWDALRWGMVGLFVKGGIWIGFAGAFLGIGLSRQKYRAFEVLTLMATLVGCFFLGRWLLNEPYRPFGPDRELPLIYFSDHWNWEPDKVDMKPRRESWGGLLLALSALFVYVGWFKRDRLARNMTIAGFLSGGFGFTLGQSVQAAHQWGAPFTREGIFTKVGNWWNMMETTFGLVLGLGLGIGVWLNRHLIGKHDAEASAEPTLTPAMEWILFVLYIGALFPMDFQFVLPVIATAVPFAFIVGGRYFPYLQALPLLAIPIAVKTLRARGGLQWEITDEAGTHAVPLAELAIPWLLYLVLPLTIMLIAGVFFARRSLRGQPGLRFTRWGLVLSAWMYFGLNFAFWNFPKFEQWSGPGWIFGFAVVVLTLAGLFLHRRGLSDPEVGEEDPAPNDPAPSDTGAIPGI